MDERLRKVIIWPDRESLKKTMPDCFPASFGEKVTVILDCFEVFFERPTNLEARAATWSSYKHHNTVKVLLGITPQGSVSYVSDTGVVGSVTSTSPNTVGSLITCFLEM